MEIYILLAGLGYLIDLMVGDPPRLPHPVVYIGRMIGWLDRFSRRVVATPMGLKLAGLLTTVLVVAASFVITVLILRLAGQIHYFLYLLLASWTVAATVATRGLAEAAEGVRTALAAGDLTLARQKVSWIVGRDTNSMDSSEAVRATVETVAENLVDAVIAPLFYALIGGPALAMAYRAVNTLDSMVGYKNEKYIHFGWASARLDDIANFFPARIAGIVLILAAWLSNRKWQAALTAWGRDAALHPSPNSGIPESTVAGALGIRLGGTNIYGGVVSFRHYMGEPTEQIRPDHIGRVVNMLYLAAAIFMLLSAAVYLAIYLVCVNFA